MKNVLEFIEKQLLKTKTHLKNTKEHDILFSYWMGYGVALTEFKREILNEAVVCDGERNKTMCKRVVISSPEATEVAQYCLKCKKEFDFFGKEITS